VHGRQGLDLVVLATAAAFFVATLAILVPAWGYVGAALATALATIAQLAIRVYLVRTRLGFPRPLPA
jgi:O-antigen/teichoic acid export membrane protein